MKQGAFRDDLYARLAEIVVRPPALRERREDVLLLLDRAYPEPRPPLTPELVEALLLHPWPFNVRELFTVARQLEIEGEGREVLDLDLVAERLEREPSSDEPRAGTTEPPSQDELPPVPDRATLVDLLRTHGGNISALGRVLGRSRRQVYRYLDDHGLDPHDFRDPADS